MLTVEALLDSSDSRLLQSARELFRRYGDFLRASGGHLNFRFDLLELEILELPAHYTARNGEVLLARYNDAPAGCAAFRAFPGLSDPHCCEIKRLFVAPEFRGHAIGRQLVESALDRARRKGYRLARLDTDPATMPAAHRLYLNEGFVEYSSHNPDGETPLIFLQKALD